MSETPPLSMGSLLYIVQFISAAIVIPGMVALIKLLWNIREHLGKLNGHVQENLQRWIEHDKQTKGEAHAHEMMHTACAALHQERLAAHQDRVERLSQQVTQIWGRLGDRRTGKE